MNITLAEKTYAVTLEDNITVKDIVSHMPLDLSMVRYAGHVYYWDGWNAFVINYVDYDITPYQVVHIGEITDSTIVDILKDADENIDIIVTH